MNNSILAWIDERTQSNAKSNKLKIVNLLTKHEALSSRQMSELLYKEHESIRKRCSDLLSIGIICKSGNREENGYQNSVYSLNQNYEPITVDKRRDDIDKIVNLLEDYCDKYECTFTFEPNNVIHFNYGRI